MLRSGRVLSRLRPQRSLQTASLSRPQSKRCARHLSSSASKTVLVHGGKGALGKSMVQRFRSSGWHVISSDFSENPEASHSIVLDAQKSWQDGARTLVKELQGQHLQAVVCSAGGFAMGPVKEDGFLDTADKMVAMNLFSSFTASHVAAKLLLPGSGLLVLTGAAAATQGTGFAAAYGASKSAVNQLVASMAQDLSSGSRAIGILPVTIDTPQNRKDMPDADFSSWTPPEAFASQVVSWAQGDPAPVNGELYIFHTKAGQTKVTPLADWSKK